MAVCPFIFVLSKTLKIMEPDKTAIITTSNAVTVDFQSAINLCIAAAALTILCAVLSHLVKGLLK